MGIDKDKNILVAAELRCRAEEQLQLTNSDDGF
jgi:hypothetical protein